MTVVQLIEELERYRAVWGGGDTVVRKKKSAVTNKGYENTYAEYVKLVGDAAAEQDGFVRVCRLK
jgi:hypothetical protein